MKSAFAWLKANKITAVLLVLVLFLLLRRTPIVPLASRISSSDFGVSTMESKSAVPAAPNSVGGGDLSASLPSQGDFAPQPDVTDRLVVEKSYLSLLVKNVSGVMDTIVTQVSSFGGYMVNRYITTPEEGASGTLTVRVPSEKLDEALGFFRKAAVRVVSENLQGEDVTDQYTDINTHLEILNRTKAKFEEIMLKATTVSEILQVERELTNLQSQIDSLKGQAQYLEKNAAMAKVTLYLSTDELSLPYAPSQPWRPKMIFKQAVRQLVSTLRNTGSAAIWVGVYSVVWLPILLAIVFVPKLIKRRRMN